MKNIQAIHPLAPSQLGMLLESLSSPASGLHIEQLSCAVNATLQPQLFQQAWSQVIQRHSILRTAFVSKDRAEPLQVVMQEVNFAVTTEDWSHLQVMELREKWASQLSAERDRGFTLTRPPLMRVGLFKVGPQRFQFVWTVHHILLDGWCLPLVLNEVLEIYSALEEGKSIHLPPPGQYGDYVTWLRRQSLPSAEQFWKQELAGFSHTTSFGDETTEWQLPLVGFEQANFILPEDITTVLRAKASAAEVSIPVAIQCIWALVLGRLSASSDIVFGVTVSGRPADLPKVETIVGLFINTVPARFILDRGMEFWSWAARIQAKHNARRSFEFVSSGQIHSWSGFSGSVPLYETLLVVENAAPKGDSLNLSRLQVEASEAVGARTHYPLTLLLSVGDKIQGEMVFDQSRISLAGIELIAQLFTSAATAISQSKKPAELHDMLNSLPRPSVRKRVMASRTDSVAPRDITELRLTELWESLLQRKAIGVKDNFFELGGHSLLVLQLKALVESTFGIALPLICFIERPTVEQQSVAIRNSTTDSSSLVALKPSGLKPPLFCFHPLGGGVLNYVAFARYVNAEQPIFGFQAQGLDKGQKACNSIGEMAASYANEIQAKFPSGPVALAGLSFGGLVAFETASILLSAGRELVSLSLFDTPAPHIVPDRIKTSGPSALLVSLFSPGMPLQLQELEPLNLPDQLHLVHQRCHEYDLLPRELGLDEFTRIFSVWSGFYSAAINYHPSFVPTQLQLFRASEDSLRVSDKPALGWDVLASSVEVHWVPGRHEDMDQEPHVIQLAQAWQKANDAPSPVPAAGSLKGTSGF